MKYLLDTVTLVRHFTKSGKIGKRAKNILKKSENTFVISVVSLMEILYLSEKHRIRIDLNKTIKRIEASSKYSVADLTSDVIIVAKDVAFYELHDRLILSTAKYLDIPIISCDKKFEKLQDVKVILD